MLEDLDDALSESGREALKDEVRIGFRDRPAGRIRNVVTQNDIVERKRGGWTMWEMRKCECGWCTTVLMEEDHVGES